jgi:hypothetical protein
MRIVTEQAFFREHSANLAKLRAAGRFALDVHRFSVFYPGFVGTPPK